MDENDLLKFEGEISKKESSFSPRTPKKKQAGFAIDVFKLAGGTAFVQFITFLASPIISRLFAPEDFGLSANFTAIIMIANVLACLGYESSIMLPKTDEEAANQFGICIISTIFISLISFPILWIFRGIIIGWLKTPELLPLMWMVPVMIFLSGIFQAFNYWNSRTRRYLRLSIAQMTRSVSEYASKITVGLAGFASGASMISTGVFGQAVSSTILGFQILRDDHHLFQKAIRPKEMWVGAKRYIKFPLFNTWSALLGQISQQLPTFLLTAYFSTAIAGQYSMGYKILRLPIALIGGSIAQVFYQRASIARHEGTLAELVEKTSHQLIVFGLYPMLLLTISGREVFTLVFGERWADAGVFSQILSIWTFFVLISSPMSRLFSVLEKNEFGLVFNIVLIITRFTSLAIGGMLHNIILALVFYSVSGSIAYLYLQFELSKQAGIPIRRAAGHIIKNMIFSTPFLAVVAIVKWFSASNPLYVTLISGVMGIVYYIALFYVDQSVREVVFDILKNLHLKKKHIRP